MKKYEAFDEFYQEVKKKDREKSFGEAFSIIIENPQYFQRLENTGLGILFTIINKALQQPTSNVRFNYTSPYRELLKPMLEIFVERELIDQACKDGNLEQASRLCKKHEIRITEEQNSNMSKQLKAHIEATADEQETKSQLSKPRFKYDNKVESFLKRIGYDYVMRNWSQAEKDPLKEIFILKDKLNRTDGYIK